MIEANSAGFTPPNLNAKEVRCHGPDHDDLGCALLRGFLGVERPSATLRATCRWSCVA